MVHYAMSYPGVAVEVILIVIGATIPNYCATVISNPFLSLYVALLLFTLLYIAIFLCVRNCFKFKARRYYLFFIRCILIYNCIFVVLTPLLVFLYYAQRITDFVDDTWETVTMCNSHLTMSFVSQSVLVSMFVCSSSLHAFSLWHFTKDYRTKNQVISTSQYCACAC